LDRTLRRRRDEWTALGVMQQLWHLALAAYDRMIGLELSDLAIDSCITKAPCGGEVAGRSPVDRGKHGLKRSMITDARGIQLGVVPAAASRNDHSLLGATLDALDALGRMGPFPELQTVHLDRGYVNRPGIRTQTGSINQIQTNSEASIPIASTRTTSSRLLRGQGSAPGDGEGGPGSSSRAQRPA
jgi:hypothetical protein